MRWLLIAWTLLLGLALPALAEESPAQAAGRALLPALERLEALREPLARGEASALDAADDAASAWNRLWLRHERVVERTDWMAYDAVELAALDLDVAVGARAPPAAAEAIAALSREFRAWAGKRAVAAAPPPAERPVLSRAVLLLAAFLATAYEAAPWLVLGFLVAGAIHVFVPQHALLRLLGGRGPWPLARSILCGLLLPICSCGVVPIAVGLHRGGAPIGSTLAFLIAAPALSPVTACALWSLLGPRFAIAYALSVVLTAVAVALVANRLFRARAAAPAAAAAPVAACAAPAGPRARRVVAFAFHGYGAEVSFDILFGLLLASAAVALVPGETIARFVGTAEPSTYLIIALIAAPVYVCTLPSIPVMANLVGAGMVPGAAITYLIGGSATNLGEIKVIARQMSWTVALFFAGALVCAACLTGLVADRLGFLVPAASAPAAQGDFIPDLLGIAGEACPCISPSWSAFNTIGAIALVYILVVGGWQHARRVWNGPCSVCGFWSRMVHRDGFRACERPCWLLRTTSALRRVVRRR